MICTPRPDWTPLSAVPSTPPLPEQAVRKCVDRLWLVQQDFFKHVSGLQSPHPVLFRYQHMFKGIKVGLVVDVARRLSANPRQGSGCWICVFRALYDWNIQCWSHGWVFDVAPQFTSPWLSYIRPSKYPIFRGVEALTAVPTVRNVAARRVTHGQTCRAEESSMPPLLFRGSIKRGNYLTVVLSATIRSTN